MALTRKLAVLAALVLCVAAVQGLGQAAAAPSAIDLARQQWNGLAVCYSGFRGAENPDKEIYPSDAEVAQDMAILARHWPLIRMYGADAHTESVLRTIHRKHLPIKVMLGMWLSGKPGKEAANERQIAEGIRMAKKYHREVAAVSVGNEALVSWSDHQMTEDALIAAVERVRHAVKAPVTVADDFLYWMQPAAKLVEHVDFITLHIYPVWGREDIDTAIATTNALYVKVQKAHPGKTIVLGEVGWPTYTEGDKHAPRAGDERKQKVYFEQLNQWAQANHVTAFVFEAFDESWKGSGTEGHWGLFSEDRLAKPAVLDWYPELKPDHPLSPSYDDAAKKVTP